MTGYPATAVIQMHSIAGDVEGNASKLLVHLKEAVHRGARIVVAPEMALSGYPVEDLLGDEAFLLSVYQQVQRLARNTPQGVTFLVGLPVLTKLLPNSFGLAEQDLDSLDRRVTNSVAVLQDGRVEGWVHKHLLPTYGIFDDSRWVRQGVPDQELFTIGGVRTGVAICEDVWTDEVVHSAAQRGAKVVLVANASPYVVGKPATRLSMLRKLAAHHGVTIVYANSVGGQDEVVFDGGSMVVAPDGRLLMSAPLFTEGVYLWSDEESDITAWSEDNEEQIWQALVTGLRDYAAGAGFTRVIVGLSGGIDCAVAAAIAVDALGSENVWGVGMPGPYSSLGSVDDADALARRLGIEFTILPITRTVSAEESLIGDLIADGPNVGIARENIQARLRALHIMTLANAFNMMMLNTGNKSEAAVGYFTLGGDSSGGFAILKDVYKTEVYRLAEWRNNLAVRRTGSVIIPLNSITKPPSAELAENQQDTDSLPPYPVLDAILEAYIEHLAGTASIVRNLQARHLVTSMDDDEAYALVRRVLGMVDRAEHKRRQVAPGPNITMRSLNDRSRRMPIVNRRQH